MWRLPAITPVANIMEDFKHRLQIAEQTAHQWFAASSGENPKWLFAKCETVALGDHAARTVPSALEDAIWGNSPLTESFIQWLFRQNEPKKEFTKANTVANETANDIIQSLPESDEPVHLKSLFPRDFMKKYRLLNADDYVLKLGEGGFGSVVRCVHRGTGTHKAAKFFDGREAQGLRAWKRVEKHPNVVSLVDHFTSSVSHVEVAVMNLCHGVDVSDWLQENGDAILESDACHIFKYMVRACAHLHACGVLHRDLKLENFIFNNASLHDMDTSSMDDLRLCDFGLAKPMEEEDEGLEAGVLLGTPIYMAPEVLDGSSYSAASDVYALGVCLFILLTRHFPFSNKIPRDEPNFQLLDECSHAAQNLIRGMLKENPAERLTLHDVASHPFLRSVRTNESSGPRQAMQRRDSLTEVAFHSSEVQLAERTLSAGAVLFHEGDMGEDVYVVDEGDVEVWKDGIHVATLHSGDIVGEMALVYSQRRSATVKSGPAGASLLKLQGTDARRVWEKKKAIPALRSMAQIGSERDEFNESFAFFRSMYPTANPTFLVDLVQSLAPENQRRVEKNDTLIGDDEVYVCQKVFYVRTGELSVYHKGKLVYFIPPGSFIGAPCVMASLHAPRGFECGSGANEKIRIVAREEADVIELPLHAMERLQNRHAEDHARFLQEATTRWIVPEDSACAQSSGVSES